MNEARVRHHLQVLLGVTALCAPLGLFAAPAVDAPRADAPRVDAILDALNAVHSFSEAALAPDGKHLVYGTILTGKRGGADVDVSALWIVNAKDGSDRVRLTACPGTLCDEHGAAWSPDGSHLAFVTTDAAEQAQVAVAAAHGGPALILTQAHGPLDTPRWSPDGRRLAFLYAEGAPKLPGPLNPLGRDAGELSATIFEQRLATVAAGGGATTLLGPADLNVYEYDWSPDGTQFALTAAHGSGDNNWWIADLEVMDAATGAVRTVCKPALQIASPRWSGDGTRIAYIGGLMSDETITGGDLYVIGANGGAPLDVTPALAASVHTFTWNGSRSHIVATEFAAGEEELADVDVEAKSQRVLWHAPQMIWANTIMGFEPGDAGISLSRDGKYSAVIRQSYVEPPEVETGPPGHWRPITHDNDHVVKLTGEVKNVTWKSAPYDVQGMLIAPPSLEPGKRYPLVVDIHGGPAFAHYPVFPNALESFDAALASHGYFVFKPNPRGSYGQGEAFTQANVKDFGGGDLRDILTGIDTVLKDAPIDADRVGITGWSYGGYVAMWALTQSNRFKAAVAGAGLSDWLSYYGTNDIDTWMIPYFGASIYDDPQVYERSSPIHFIKQVRTPTLLLSGDRDAEVPISQSYEYWNALRRLGVKTQFVVYPDEGHFFFKRDDQLDAMTRVVGWFDENMK
jgi:dipeptidyl aminopeptidase/acylaminoacyl peptidase